MTADHTQHQTDDDSRRARQLSLQRSQPPTEVPGYELKRFLGAGAYGEVWIGSDENTGRRVAVKFFLHRGGVDWSLLSREVEKLVFLSADRYVVQLLDVGWEADPPYYVMEYVENGSLERFLHERDSLPIEDAVEMFREITVGLMHAHGKGVLHCDLKPANILLDQDNKPRLADFGQSRLSHEQTPSLGTLFYMAPEQAHLDAVPDARWDVYALGAILYCMLTGAPPHRCESTINEIDTAGELTHRLEKYRNAIIGAPVPSDHHRLAGMDRGLLDIVDRCLALEPDNRFNNVQEVLHELEERDKQRARRPLLLLGLVSPTLLLVIMVFFSVRLYKQAIREAEQTVTSRVHDGNQWVANHVARRIEDEFQRYFEIIESEASGDRLQQLVREVEKNPIVKQLRSDQLTPQQRERMQDAFLSDDKRTELKAFLKERLGEYLDNAERSVEHPRLASMFIVDQKGTMLAVAYDRPVATKSVGNNYSWRTYFHGQPSDLARQQTPLDLEPITQTQLSTVFRSTTTKLWKVAVSTPIVVKGSEDDEFLGIMAISVNLGDFPYIRSKNQAHRFAVLVDGRGDDRRGTILQHPLFDGRDLLTDEYLKKELRVPTDQLQRLREGKPKYRDPMARASDGAEYEGEWIAAMTGVKLPNQSSDGSSAEFPDLIVVVQESYSAATAPLYQFGKLVLEGLLAVGSVMIVVGTVWFFVGRTFRRPSRTQAGARSPDDKTGVHDQTTLHVPPPAD